MMLVIPTVLADFPKLDTAKAQAAVLTGLAGVREQLVIWIVIAEYTALLIRVITLVIVQVHVHVHTAQTHPVQLHIQIVNTADVMRITAMMTRMIRVITARRHVVVAAGQTSRQLHVMILDMSQAIRVITTTVVVSMSLIRVLLVDVLV